MEAWADLAARCAAMLALLNVELGWRLSADECATYCAALAGLIEHTCLDARLRQAIVCYHLDHALVEALADRLHHQHDPSWAAWMERVLAILRGAGLAWSDDAAIGADDLAQVARAELARALPGFRYGSRFSTWSHQVIVRSVRRYLRDLRAHKRAARPASLDRSCAPEPPVDSREHPEALADARVLAALIDSILAEQPDKRLAEIFRLWAHADLQVEEIGRRVRLSQSQVRLLLGRIREVLRNDPSISEWRDREPGGWRAGSPATREKTAESLQTERRGL